MSDFQRDFIEVAIEIYGLELDRDRIDTIVATWFQKYDRTWILKAIVESLYRGRYKIVSVENILKDWQRLGSPRYQFTPEYEREILEKIPQQPKPIPELSPTTEEPIGSAIGADARSSDSIDPEDPNESERFDPPVRRSEDLNPEESAPFQSRLQSSSAHNNDRVAVSADSPAKSPEDPPQSDSSNQDRDNSPESSDRSDPPGYPSSAKLEQIVIQPVSRKLFNTLKAIVDPNNQYREATQDSNSFPPLAAGNVGLGNIANFKMPLENTSEERHV
jgi:hypothetical protein